MDLPNRQLGTIILPPDPMPIMNARPEQYALDEQPVSVRYTAAGEVRIIEGHGAAYNVERIIAVPGNLTLRGGTSVVFSTPSPYVVSADNGTYSGSPYWAFNNDYGKGVLVNGVGFTETITVDTITFPVGTTMAWSWPAGSAIRGFPSIIYGTQQTLGTPADIVVPTPKIVDNFTSLSVAFNYSVTGPAVDHNVIIDAWLRSSAIAPTQANLLWELDIGLYFDWLAASSNDKYPIKYTTSAPTFDVIVIPNFPNATTNGMISVSPYAASTNLFSNTAMAGSANGTPGTDPTDTLWFGAPSGLTKTVVGSGSTTAADGISVNYVDTRWHGTAGAAGTIRFNIADISGIAAVNGQIWEGDIYLALTAGSWGVSTVTWGLYYWTSGYSGLGARNSNPLTTDGVSTTGPTSVLNRWRHTAKTANASTALASYELNISVASGQVVDFTVRIAAPKMGLSVNPQMYSGTVDVKSLLTGLKAKGVIAGTEYIAGIEFGPEPVQGVGGISVGSYSVVWS